MASFRLSKPYTMPKSALRSAARDLADRLEARHGLRAQWQGNDEVSIKGAGVEGRLTIDRESVDVSVKLGLLASAFQGVLRSEIQRYLDEHVS